MADHTRASEQLQFDFSATEEIPYGYCQCGCGQLAPIAKETNTKRGRIKGQPQRFIHGHNGRKNLPAPEGFKTCTRCKKTKELNKFYRFKSGPNNGKYRSYCAHCFQETWKERFADQEKHLQLTARRRTWRAANRERTKEIKLKTQSKHQQRHAARLAVRYQVASGKFPPASTMVCELCQEAKAAHWHHHQGYDNEHRLDVIAVCVTCHCDEHRMDL